MRILSATWNETREPCGFACAAALVLAGVFSVPLWAQQPDKPPSVDDALLDDLDNELLEGLGGLEKPKPKPDPAKPDEPKPDEPKPAGEPAPRIDGEDIGSPSADDDPLGYISQEMRLAEQLISERGKQSHAEQIQTRIIEDLTKLIEQAERQRNQQSSSSSQNQQQQQQAQRQKVKQPESASAKPSGSESNQPASDSSNRLGRAEQARPDPRVFRGLMKDAWGHLPDRDREQMRQLSPERFLPQYELMIERYYRRLAEERSP